MVTLQEAADFSVRLRTDVNPVDLQQPRMGTREWKYVRGNHTYSTSCSIGKSMLNGLMEDGIGLRSYSAVSIAKPHHVTSN